MIGAPILNGSTAGVCPWLRIISQAFLRLEKPSGNAVIKQLERFFDERRNIARRRIEPPDTRVLAEPGALPLRVAARGQLDPLHSLVKRDEPVESLHDLLVPDSLRRRHAFAKAPVEQPFHFRHARRA